VLCGCVDGACDSSARAASDLLLPEPHPLKPGIGLLKAPAVIGFQNVGDGDHLNGIDRQRGWGPQALGN
jgi:hypothetical protein